MKQTRPKDECPVEFRDVDDSTVQRAQASKGFGSEGPSSNLGLPPWITCLFSLTPSFLNGQSGIIISQIMYQTLGFVGAMCKMSSA